MTTQTLHPICRFCKSTLSIPVPTDERLGQMVRTLATKACCNRCADYKRDLRDLSDMLQATAFLLMREGEDHSAARANIGRICKRVVALGEDHYLLSGLMPEVEDFVTNVCNDPRGARAQVEVFDRMMVKLYIQTHGQRQEAYAY